MLIGGGSLLGHSEMISAQALIIQKNKQKKRENDLKNERLSKKNGGVKKESDYMRKKALNAAAAAAAAAAASAATAAATPNGVGSGMGPGQGQGSGQGPLQGQGSIQGQGSGQGSGMGLGMGPGGGVGTVTGTGTGTGNSFIGADTTQTAASYGQFANGGELR